MRVLSALILLAVFIGCKQKTSTIDTMNQPFIFTNNVSVFEQNKIEEQWGNCEDENHSCMNIHIEYPVMKQGSEAVYSFLQEYLEDYFADFLAVEKPVASGDVNQFLYESIKQKKNELQDNTSEYPLIYQLEIQVIPIYTSEKLISFSSFYSAYQGGTHPNSGSGYVIYNAETNEVVTQDVFVKDEALKEKLLVKLKQGSSEDLESLGFLVTDDQFEIGDNFGIDKDSLYFTYSPYEIAPYSMGFFSISFAKDEVKDFVGKDFFTMWNH